MARLRESVSESLLGALLAICAGCGGGSSAIQQPPPPAPSPPQPDFSMVISASTISVTQGTTSSPVNVSVNPLNGFSGTVQVTLGGLPSGVTSNPSSPFNLGAGSNTSVVFGAAANAGTGTFTITAQGGALSHGANLQLTVNVGVVTALPRTTFARADSTPAADDPQGEPRRRSIAYDPANKHVFVANRAMNCVEVFSSADASRAAQISIAGASSADLSADGATVWIGTVTEQVAAIDTASLQVKALYATSGLLPVPPVPNTVFDRPEELLALSNGKLMNEAAAGTNGRSIAGPVGSGVQHREKSDADRTATLSEWTWRDGANRRSHKSFGRGE